MSEGKVGYMYCELCNGSGDDPEIVYFDCCGAECADWECGGSGCTGPQPQPTPCRDCGGSGKMPID